METVNSNFKIHISKYPIIHDDNSLFLDNRWKGFDDVTYVLITY